MNHPFAGIAPEVSTKDAELMTRQTRRTIVARLIGAIASVAGLAQASTAGAQSPRKRPSVSCWSGRCPPGQPAPPPPPPTAVGDSVDGFAATTQAVGEEGGQTPVLVSKPPKAPANPLPRPTTRAAGEEGGGAMTTQALLEEGAGGVRPQPGLRRPPSSAPTSRASGEEGGSSRRPPTSTPSTSEAAMLELLYGDLD